MDLEEYRILRNKFQENYFKTVKPKLNVYEEKRLSFHKIYKNKVIPVGILLLLFFIIGAIANIKNAQMLSGFLFLLANLTLAICIVTKIALEQTLEREIKDELMQTLCSCFDNLKWSRRRIEEHFDTFGLVPSYNNSYFDDIFNGSYNGIDFEIIEAELRKVKRSSKGSSDITIFDGIILKINSKSDFNSHTIIKKDTSIKHPPRNLRHTELEDVVFEKKYDVYTNDEVKARVLITTPFMEKISSLEKVFNAKEVSCAFYNKYFYIALHTNKDMFKLCSLNNTINDITLFAKTFEEIISIYNVIDYLNMGNKNIAEKG